MWPDAQLGALLRLTWDAVCVVVRVGGWVAVIVGAVLWLECS